jgi:hypothetical protein
MAVRILLYLLRTGTNVVHRKTGIYGNGLREGMCFTCGTFS